MASSLLIDDSWADDLCWERLRTAPSGEVATLPPGTTEESGRCWGISPQLPLTGARPVAPPTSTAGHTHGRPPELAARVQHLRKLRTRLQARLSDQADPTYGEVMETVVCTIDELLDLLDTAGCWVPVMSSHVERCIMTAERWLSSLPGSLPGGSPAGL